VGATWTYEYVGGLQRVVVSGTKLLCGFLHFIHRWRMVPGSRRRRRSTHLTRYAVKPLFIIIIFDFTLGTQLLLFLVSWTQVLGRFATQEDVFKSCVQNVCEEVRQRHRP
jgi:hypothetical protein